MVCRMRANEHLPRYLQRFRKIISRSNASNSPQSKTHSLHAPRSPAKSAESRETSAGQSRRPRLGLFCLASRAHASLSHLHSFSLPLSPSLSAQISFPHLHRKRKKKATRGCQGENEVVRIPCCKENESSSLGDEFSLVCLR